MKKSFGMTMFERDICFFWTFYYSKIWCGYQKIGTIVKTQNGGNTSMESKISYFHFQNNKLFENRRKKNVYRQKLAQVEHWNILLVFIQSIRWYFLHEFLDFFFCFRSFRDEWYGIVIQKDLDEGLCLNEEWRCKKKINVYCASHTSRQKGYHRLYRTHSMHKHFNAMQIVNCMLNVTNEINFIPFFFIQFIHSVVYKWVCSFHLVTKYAGL